MIRLAPILVLCSLTGILGTPSLGPSSPPGPIEGIVRELGGAPLASARVDLLVDGALVASARTDQAGRFYIVLRAEGLATRAEAILHVSRMGYHDAEVSLSGDRRSQEIALAPAPLPIPGFRVEFERESCPGIDEEPARRLWERAVDLHPGGLDTLGVASYTLARTDTLSRDPPTTLGVEGAVSGQRASASLLRLSWTRRIDREGYAFHVRRSGRTRSYDSWSYPPLEADYAPHFGSESFGSLHDFRVELEDGEGWILRFCGRITDTPYLEGILELGPDTLLRRAEWRFHTPAPDEEAGGWTRFPPAGVEEEPPPLLPVESMTWRSLPDGEVMRRAQWYEGWIMVEGDSVPFLPRRPGDTDLP